MARETRAQKKTVGRVMHEYAHGELKSGPQGKGGKVKSRRQAIAIALKEAGESKDATPAENRRNLARSKRKEAQGRTAQQEAEGKSHVGARGQRSSSPAMRKSRKSTTARKKTTARKSTTRRRRA